MPVVHVNVIGSVCVSFVGTDRRDVEVCDADLFSTSQVNLYCNELCRIKIIISNIDKNFIERDALVDTDKQASTTVAFGSFAGVAVSSDNGETIKVEGLVLADEFGFLDAEYVNLVFVYEVFQLPAVRIDTVGIPLENPDVLDSLAFTEVAIVFVVLGSIGEVFIVGGRGNFVAFVAFPASDLARRDNLFPSKA